jgi:hypothetical protein
MKRVSQENLLEIWASTCQTQTNFIQYSPFWEADICTEFCSVHFIWSLNEMPVLKVEMNKFIVTDTRSLNMKYKMHKHARNFRRIEDGTETGERKW